MKEDDQTYISNVLQKQHPQLVHMKSSIEPTTDVKHVSSSLTHAGPTHSN